MAYTEVFGGTTIQPSQVSYRSVSISENYQFSWPQTNEDNDTVLAATTDVNATVSGLSVAMPDATLVANGFPTVFTNEHTNTYTVTDIDGNTITTVASGQVKYVLLKDNSTSDGVWYSFTFGVGTSSANAASLAGAGLVALGVTLNEEFTPQAKNANYKAIAGDRASLLQWTGGSGTFSFTASSILGTGWFVLVKNSGSGTLTLDPNASETIDGMATLQLAPEESLIAITDGVNFYTVGLGRSLITTFTRLVKSVAGGTDVTLTATEASNNIIELTGTLTANINVIIPTTVSSTDFYNNTNGAFTIDIKTSAGTGIVLPQGTRQILLCDGTNVVKAVDSGTGTITNIATNSGLTGGPITTTGTIGIATNGVTNALFRQAAALSVVGNSSNALANTADIAFVNDGEVIKRSGTDLVSGKIQAVNMDSQTATNGQVPTADGSGGVAYADPRGFPIGSLFFWPSPILPTNAMIRSGQAISRTSFAVLFNLLVTVQGFTQQTFSVTIASPAVFTKAAHGFLGGERIRLFTTGALPSGLNTTTDYYVIFIDGNTFNVSSTFGGAAITTTGSQSGSQTYLQSLYGLGDGSTTFNLPNDIDQFERGWNSATRGFGTQQLDAFQGHIHKGFGQNQTAPGGGGLTYDGGISNPNTNPTGVPITDGTNGTPRIATETRPVNRAYLPCIQVL